MHTTIAAADDFSPDPQGRGKTFVALTYLQALLNETNERLSTERKVIWGPTDLQAFLGQMDLKSALNSKAMIVIDSDVFFTDPASPASQSQQQILDLFSGAVDRLKETGSTDDFFSELEGVTGPLKPAARWILTIVLWPILIGVLGNLATGPIQDFLSHTHNQTQTQEAIPKPLLLDPSANRFAKTEGVRIRKSPDTKAEIISRMHRGQIVQVKENRGAWLLIELNSGDTQVVGWTYSSTLGKFINK